MQEVNYLLRHRGKLTSTYTICLKQKRKSQQSVPLNFEWWEYNGGGRGGNQQGVRSPKEVEDMADDRHDE